jgi:D-2-hydroxyacid dehydrogenase (NADP+)
MHVLIALPDADDYKEDLQARFPELPLHTVRTEADIRLHADKVDVLITIFRVADEILKKLVHLKWIQVTTSGVNYLLSRPSLRKDIIVTTCRGIHGPQVSEMAFLLMLALNRNFPAVVRNQDRKVWERWPGRLLFQKKAGVLGLGAIGEEIARKCKAFGMTVYGIDIVQKGIDCVDHFFGPQDLLRVAEEIDYLIVAAPSTPETYKIIGRDVLARMRPSAFLINIARGEMVDEEALTEALNRGAIAGAGLDALTAEPLPPDHPLWEARNVIISPHVGGVSDCYREQVMPIIEENLRRYVRGERRNLVNYVVR